MIKFIDKAFSMRDCEDGSAIKTLKRKMINSDWLPRGGVSLVTRGCHQSGVTGCVYRQSFFKKPLFIFVCSCAPSYQGGVRKEYAPRLKTHSRSNRIFVSFFFFFLFFEQMFSTSFSA